MQEIKFTELKCGRCGGQLQKGEGDVYECLSCGKTYEKTAVINMGEEFRGILNEIECEKIANLRQLLWNEINEEFVSNREVERVCLDILRYLPEDFYANFYLATCTKSKTALGDFLQNVDIDERYDDIPDMLEYLIKGLKPEWSMAVGNFIERAYKNSDIKLYNKFRTEFEKVNAEIEEGVFEPSLPRDVFIAYSSADMPEVERLTRALEDEGLMCFVAARNLRHGSGSVENYENAIHTAIDHCSVLVFVSSQKSRSLNCDAYKELNYIGSRRKNMPRVEYLIKNYSGRATERFFENFFEGKEYCLSEKDVAERVLKILMTGREEPDKNITENNGEKPNDKEYASTNGESLQIAAWLTRANQEGEAGDFSKAKEYYNKVLDVQPENGEAWEGLFYLSNATTKRKGIAICADERDFQAIQRSIQKNKAMVNSFSSREFEMAVRYSDAVTAQKLLKTQSDISREAQEFEQKIYIRLYDLAETHRLKGDDTALEEYDMMLSLDRKCAKAYWGKFLYKMNAADAKTLKQRLNAAGAEGAQDLLEQISASNDYKGALQTADGSLAEEIKEVDSLCRMYATRLNNSSKEALDKAQKSYDNFNTGYESKMEQLQSDLAVAETNWSNQKKGKTIKTGIIVILMSIGIVFLFLADCFMIENEDGPAAIFLFLGLGSLLTGIAFIIKNRRAKNKNNELSAARSKIRIEMQTLEKSKDSDLAALASTLESCKKLYSSAAYIYRFFCGD